MSSFGAVALLGTLLLMLPASSRTGGWSAPEDCLFTATSAVCVTGLIVKSPAHWSPSGQLVILALIQAGGLGIMTLGAFVAFMVRRRMSMRFEAFMTDMVEPEATQSVWPLIRFVCLFTLFAEAIGAFVLFWAWRSHFKSAWLCLCHSVFHAVSAFCNAGFSLNKDNLVGYVDDSGVNLTICLLIVIGGIGFSVVRDVQRYCRWWMFQRRGRRPHLSEHSKLALLVTGVLLLVGFVAFFVLESGYTLRNAPLKTRVLASMFQSVTPRTAGYNTVDTAACALPTSLLTMVLMFIGGSPGGTAGGIKTTTLGVMIASVLATLRGRRRAEVFGHSVPEETVHRTASIILLSVGALIAVVFLLLLTETAPFEPVVFDAVSAFGTVGLSRGFTGPDCDVTAWGKLLLTFLMFVGRLGPITLVLSVARRNERAPYSYPEGQVLVG